MVMLLSNKLRVSEGGGERRLSYWCQGCQELHQVRVEGSQAWGWNRDAERPTFSPSVLYQRDVWFPPVTPENLAEWRRAPWPQEQKRTVCHTFIRDGMVQFLGDCTHALAGQTLPLPDLPERWRTPPEQL